MRTRRGRWLAGSTSWSPGRSCSRSGGTRIGVYAVGRCELSPQGELMAAVLACRGAALSHTAAAELWGIGPRRRIEVTVPGSHAPRRPGIVIHRAALAPEHTTRRHGIPVTKPARTLVDLAPHLQSDHLERAVNEADRLDE